MALIGERIKQTRQAKGLSAEDVAEAVGVSPATMYRYESGKIKKINFETAQKVADLLRVDLNYLLGKSDTNTYYELTLEEMDELAMLDPYNRTPAKKQDLSAVFAEILQNLDADEYELDNKPVSDAARVAIKTGVNTALAMARAQK